MDGGLLFFSVIIPAHNEEAYVGKVLTSLKNINYPRDKFEVIVVENGSTDRTNDIIREYAPASFKVVRIAEPGVSRAKNRGIDLVSQISSWVIVLDADTYPGTTFFRSWIVSLKLMPAGTWGRAWFRSFPRPIRDSPGGGIASSTWQTISHTRRDPSNAFAGIC